MESTETVCPHSQVSKSGTRLGEIAKISSIIGLKGCKGIGLDHILVQFMVPAKTGWIMADDGELLTVNLTRWLLQLWLHCWMCYLY